MRVISAHAAVERVCLGIYAPCSPRRSRKKRPCVACRAHCLLLQWARLTDFFRKVGVTLSCYHPLRAFQYSGQKKLEIISKDDFIRNFTWETLKDEPLKAVYKVRALSLPCGKCIGCRLDYSHTWAVRCLLEAKESLPESCYFVTLTYEDSCISPDMRRFACDPESGEVLFPTLSLCKRDLQLFMKNLREKCARRYDLHNIRFYACGEYGTLSMRPHFHLILFNFDVPKSDLSPLTIKGKSGLPLFESAVIMDSWQKGFAPVGFMTYNSACYTAGYMLKKQKGLNADEYYSSKGIIPEFSVMSRMPGIGFEYYQKHKDYIYQNDRLALSVGRKAIAPRPPAYFDNLYKNEHGEHSLDSLKRDRMLSAIEQENVLSNRLNMPIDEFLSKKEELTILNVKNGLSLTL